MTAKLLQRKTVQATTEAEDLSISKGFAEKLIDGIEKPLLGEPKVQALGPGTFEVAFEGTAWKLRGLHRDDKINVMVDGPKGTVGEHNGTVEEVVKAINTTFEKKAGIWGRDADKREEQDRRVDRNKLRSVTDEISQAVSSYIKGLLPKLYVQPEPGKNMTLKDFLGGQSVATVFNSNNMSVKQQGYNLRSKTEQFIESQFGQEGLDAFKKQFGSNITHWFDQKAVKARLLQGKKAAAPVDYHTLPAVKEETWDDGSYHRWVKSPFLKLQVPVESPRSRDITLAVERTIPLDGLCQTQGTVTVEGMDKPRDDSYGLPLVIHSNGVDYIQDGHHRLAKDYFAGKHEAPVRYLDLDGLKKPATDKLAATPMIHEKGCIMLRPDPAVAQKVLSIGRAIVREEEVYTDPEDPSFGRETNPHSTCLWGITEKEVGARIAKVVAEAAPKFITLGNITFFPAGDKPYDVVKFDVGEEGMKEFHDALLAEFPDTKETFDYHPHMTISYVHAGLGEKVCRRASEWAGKQVSVSCVVYSSQDGGETFIDLTGAITKTAGFVVRPEGWGAHGDFVNPSRPGMAYRSMAEAEWKNAETTGVIKSDQRFCVQGEGTCFTTDWATAEDYHGFGRDDPRKSGKPFYIVEVPADLLTEDKRDGYLKAPEVPTSAVTRRWAIEAEGDALVAEEVS